MYLFYVQQSKFSLPFTLYFAGFFILSCSYSGESCSYNSFYDLFSFVRLDLSEMSIIIDGIRKVMTKIKAAGFLRLVFHDAGTFSLDDRSGT